MDELNMLRKKVADLERENRLFMETEKKLRLANQQLQSSEQLLKSRQETLMRTQRIAHVGSWDWDIASDKVSWSDELFQIFRLDPKNGAVSYANHPKLYTPESMQHLDKAVQHTLKTGEPYEIDLEIVRGDGSNAFCTARGYAKKNEKGKVIQLFGSLQDITESKKAEAELKKIEWLLQPKKEKTDVRIPDYGDLTTINQDRTILDSVGKEVLTEIVGEYLSLLETSAAVYEKNGDYAVGIFSSEWCQFMDSSSRALCKSKDNKKALESGKWLCHESCWADASNRSIQTKKAVDIECNGGLHLYAIPIKANNEVIGAINFGYGNPPTDENTLRELAARYEVSIDKLKEYAHNYETRPAFIIDIAKEKLESSAMLIGNIVERNKMKEELLKNQKRYQKAQEIGNIGNWEYDLITATFWGSDETRRIFGFKPDVKELNAERVENCIPERIRVHQALVDLIEHDKKYNLIYDILTEDMGIRKTIRSIAEVERDAQGNPLKVTGVINDITIHKKADDKLKALNQQLLANEQQLKAANQQLQANEQQLRAANQQLRANEQQLRTANESLIASEKQFRNLFNSMQEGVYLHRLVYDEKGRACNYRIIEANPISEAYVNIKREDAIGKLATELYGTREAPFIDVYAKVAETGEPVFFEQFFEPMNKYFLISVFSPEKDEFATVFLDITEKKLAEISLTRANEELNKVQEITHVGSWYMNIATNQVVWSKELYKMYGFDPLLPVPPYSEHMKLFTPESWEILSRSLAKTSTEGIPYELELRTIRDDNSKGWMWVRGEALRDENHTIIGLWGAAQDISERKQTELELLKAKEKAEEADRLKSAFLANMSHEIRTPMNGILGFTKLLQKPNLTGKQQQKYIDIIQKSGDRMLSTVNDIVDISRIESGLVELLVSEVNITEQLKYLHTFFNLEARKKGIQLIFENGLSERELIVITDLEKFNSIVTNLIKNAIKFTNQGFIEFGFHLLNKKESGKIEFYVKDTGIGIPKNRQEAVFDRFVQADIDDKQAKQGSGLGLAISKAYAEMLGGKMWVESEEGKGSTFYFTIENNSLAELEPITKNDEQILKEDEISRKLKVLVVEDDESSQYLISLVLDKFTNQFISVSSGLDAVEACRNHSDIDLIIMDIQLPGISGYEATMQIREFNTDVIIIAQTAFALAGDKEKAISSGCNDYISKPIYESELVQMVKKYFT